MNNEQKPSIKKFQLTSDIFFGVVLQDISACQEVIRIITGEDITLIEVRYQETILQLDTHSICIDIWTRDILGRHIGLEMHPQSGEDRVKRNRYTIASMDVRNLKIGHKYKDMPAVFGIYITSSDFLKTKKGINKVDRIIHNNGSLIPNGVSEYYISLNCPGDTPAQTELLKYMKNSDGIMESKYFPSLVKRVNYLKESKEGENYMCEIMDELIRKESERSEKRGEKRGVITTLRELYFTPDDICKHLIMKFNISEETAKKYMEMV